MTNEVLTIPAGVIQPRRLLYWLVKRRDECEARWRKASADDDIEQLTYEGGKCDALTEVIGYIQEGA